jgi:hypothetical protein
MSNIESMYAIAHGISPPVPLAEQELISCDVYDGGCGGGWMDNAFNWLLTSRGGNALTSASIPYQSGSGAVPSCTSINIGAGTVGAHFSSYVDISGGEAVMANFVYQHGPISIAVDATTFQFYTGGIVTSCVSSQINHAVLIVGFDKTHSPPYWIIRNQWGVGWGESGYMRAQMYINACLMANNPSSVVI